MSGLLYPEIQLLRIGPLLESLNSLKVLTGLNTTVQGPTKKSLFFQSGDSSCLLCLIQHKFHKPEHNSAFNSGLEKGNDLQTTLTSRSNKNLNTEDIFESPLFQVFPHGHPN